MRVNFFTNNQMRQTYCSDGHKTFSKADSRGLCLFKILLSESSKSVIERTVIDRNDRTLESRSLRKSRCLLNAAL